MELKLLAIAALGLVACGGARAPSRTPSSTAAPSSTGAPSSTAAPAPIEHRVQDISQMSGEIRAWRREMGLKGEPHAADRPQPQADLVCKPTTNKCTDTCTLADHICDNADDICSIARDLTNSPRYSWAQEKCTDARAACVEAREACCGCVGKKPLDRQVY